MLKVSILIASYNSRQWIGQAIETSLAQTWSNKEVLVYDDGSTDGSAEVIRAFGERIHAEFGPNQGASAARNRLIHRASGDWIQLGPSTSRGCCWSKLRKSWLVTVILSRRQCGTTASVTISRLSMVGSAAKYSR